VCLDNFHRYTKNTLATSLLANFKFFSFFSPIAIDTTEK